MIEGGIMKKPITLPVAVSLAAMLLIGPVNLGINENIVFAAEEEAQTDTLLPTANSAENTYIILVQDANDKYADTWDLPLTGFTFKLPETFGSCKGQLFPGDRGETDKYSYYIIVPDYTEYADLLRDDFGEEMYEEFSALLEDMDSIKEGLAVKEPLRPVGS